MKDHLIKSFLIDYKETENYIYGFSVWNMMYELYKRGWNGDCTRYAMFTELEDVEKYVETLEKLES